MRIAALEEALKENKIEDLEALAGAVDLCVRMFPQQLVQELGLQLLGTLIKLSLQDKRKGGQKDVTK